jgi:hypothetical protein
MVQLSFEHAHAILDELSDIYRGDAVQNKMRSLQTMREEEATKQREAFLLELQIPVVEKYGFAPTASGVQEAMVSFSSPYLLYDADIHKKNCGLEAYLVGAHLEGGGKLDEYDPQWKMLAIRDCGYFRGLPDWKYPIVQSTQKKDDIEACVIDVPRTGMLTSNAVGQELKDLDGVVKACKAGDVAKASSLLGAKRVGLGAKELLLNLGYRTLGPEAVKTLAKALSKDLETFEMDLSGNNIGLEGAKALAAGMPQKLKLLKLNLANNRIPAAGVKALVESVPKSVEILALGFAGMSIGAEGGKAIGKSIPPSLKEYTLDLYGNDVKDEGIVAIADGLPKTLEYLCSGWPARGGRPSPHRVPRNTVVI